MTAGKELPGFRLPDGPRLLRATGDRQYDEHGNEYLDLATGFGAFIHGFGDEQYQTPWEHAAQRAGGNAVGLGDLYGTTLRDEASAVVCADVAAAFEMRGEDLRAVILHSGSEAVETALKVAILNRPAGRIVAFSGAYHGTFGLALSVTHRQAFRTPFAHAYSQLTQFVSWGEVPDLDESVAAVIVEPVQGRAGIIPPPAGFLATLSERCASYGVPLIADAVLVGSGRMPSTMWNGLRPDMVCLGKALGGGVPVSATVCRADLAERTLGAIEGEAIHTSTFVGSTLGCAAICATSEARRTLGSAPDWEPHLVQLAADLGISLRGAGLVWALDFGHENAGFEWSQRLLKAGVITIPSGPTASAITLLPTAFTDPAEATTSLRRAAPSHAGHANT